MDPLLLSGPRSQPSRRTGSTTLRFHFAQIPISSGLLSRRLRLVCRSQITEVLREVEAEGAPTKRKEGEREKVDRLIVI